MKKSKLLVLSLLAVSAMSLTSCGEAGPKGEKGDQGAQGEKGDTGTPGKDGTNGVDGKSFLNGEGVPSDTLGNDGDSYVDTKTFDYYAKENGKWVLKGNIKGEKGDTGEQGEKGDTGAKGDAGAKGEKGDTGNPGSKGDTGKQGDTAWSNTILPTEHGYVTVDKGSQIAGKEVTFTFVPDDSGDTSNPYKLIDLTINGLNAPAGTTETYLSKVDAATNSLTLDMVAGGFVVAATFGKESDISGLKHYVLGGDGKYYEDLNAAVKANVTYATLQQETTLSADLEVSGSLTLDLNGYNLKTSTYTIKVTGTFKAINKGTAEAYIENTSGTKQVIVVGSDPTDVNPGNSNRESASGISAYSNGLQRFADDETSGPSLTISNNVTVRSNSSATAIVLNDKDAEITVEAGSKVFNNDSSSGATSKAIEVAAGSLTVVGEVTSTYGVAVDVKPSSVDDGTNTSVTIDGDNAIVKGASKAIEVSGGTVTVTKGNVSSESGTAVEVKQANGETAPTTTVTVSSDATVSSTSGTALSVDGGEVNVSGTVESKSSAAIKVAQASTSAETKVTVSGGTVSGTKAVEVSSGSIEVTGGTVTGSENGIAVTGGTVKVSGESTKIVSTATSTSGGDGAAISINQQASGSTIDVQVTGGTIEADAGSAIKQNNAIVAASTQTVKIDLEGGSYATNSSNAADKAVDVDTNDENVKVNNISYAISLTVESGDESGTVSATKGGVAVTSASVGDEITLTFSPANSTKKNAVKYIYVNGVEQTLKEGESTITHTMTNKGLTVKVKYVREDILNSVLGTKSGETDGTLYETVDEAFNAGCTSVTLQKDSEMQSAIKLNTTTFAINLNGHNLKVTDNEFFLLKNGAKLKFDGSGTVSGAQKDSYSLIEIQKYVENKPNELYVGKDVTLNVKGLTGEKSNQAVVISVYAKNEKVNSKIDIYGKVITDNGLGITVNGLVNSSNENVASDNVVNVYEGSTVTATKGVALYQAGLSTFNVQGGTITGDESAMEVRAGTTTISGGEFKSTASTFKATSNPGGSTTVGAGLAVVQHTTTESINVTVSGGTFTGIKGLYAADVQPTGQTSKVTINLTGGTFSSVDVRDNINCSVADAVVINGDENGVRGKALVSNATELQTALNDSKVTYIKLANDISDVTDHIGLNANREVTLDLNDKTLDLGSKVLYVDNGTLNIKGSYNSNNATNDINKGVIKSSSKIEVLELNNSGSKVVIDGACLKIDNEKGLYNNGGTLTINDAYVESAAMAVVTCNAGNTTINNGYFKTSDNAVLGTRGNSGEGGNAININGGVFEGHITTPGYIACGIYAANSDTWNVNGGTFNITNGVGIVARSGKVIIGEKVVINVTIEENCSFTEGMVGDSKINITIPKEIVIDKKSGYSGGDPTVTNNSSYTEYDNSK